MVIAPQNTNTSMPAVSGRVFWLWWLFATGGTGIVWAGALYILGWEVAIYFSAFVGLLLGLAQGIILRRFLGLQSWWLWVAGSGIGWFGAMVILFFASFIALIGSGLNDADPRGCLIWASGLSGAVFGAIQNPRTSLVGFYTVSWTIMNACAWAVAGFAGGIAGFMVHEHVPATRYVELSSNENLASYATGMLVGMLVIGAITGAGAVGFLKQGHAPTIYIKDRATKR